jgi:hypothetical protein
MAHKSGVNKVFGKLNPEQKKLLNEALQAKPYLKPLAEKLITIGGRVPVIWNDDLLTSEVVIQILLGFGRVSNGKSARLRKMQDSSCHLNAVTLAHKYPSKYQREMGYALSSDGLWRPHSWVYDMIKNQIVETTVPRTKYFGFTQVLSPSEISSL